MVLSLFLGIALIVAGTAVLTYQGVTFTTAEQQLLRVGPLQAGTQQSNWTVTLPPILGAILLAGGTIVRRQLFFRPGVLIVADQTGKSGGTKAALRRRTGTGLSAS
jgi:hypothetical protein